MEALLACESWMWIAASVSRSESSSEKKRKMPALPAFGWCVVAEWASSTRVKKDEKNGSTAAGWVAGGEGGCCVAVEFWGSSLGRAEGRSDLAAVVAGEAETGISVARCAWTTFSLSV